VKGGGGGGGVEEEEWRRREDDTRSGQKHIHCRLVLGGWEVRGQGKQHMSSAGLSRKTWTGGNTQHQQHPNHNSQRLWTHSLRRQPHQALQSTPAPPPPPHPLGRCAGHCGHQGSRGSGDAAHALHEVEGHPLTHQDGGGVTRHLTKHVTMSHPVTICGCVCVCVGGGWEGQGAQGKRYEGVQQASDRHVHQTSTKRVVVWTGGGCPQVLWQQHRVVRPSNGCSCHRRVNPGQPTLL
jgi:hypothetical protein